MPTACGYPAMTSVWRCERRQAGVKIAWAVSLGLVCRWCARCLRGRRLAVPGRVYGVLQSGHMDTVYVVEVLRRLHKTPAELYFHPSTAARSAGLSPNPGDLQTLLIPAVRQAMTARGLRPATCATEDNPDGLLRVRLTRAAHAVVLAGHTLPKGAPVLELHLWNEHVPPLPERGPDLAWAAQVRRRLVASFCALGRAMVRDTRFADVQAVGGITVLCFTGDGRREARLFERLGFAVRPYRGPLGRFGEFWENLYTWAIMWAYNAATLRRRRLLGLRRGEIWMTADEFRRRYNEEECLGDEERRTAVFLSLV